MGHRKRLIAVLIAAMLGIGAGVATTGIATGNPEGADAREAVTSEVQGPAWEALVPPVAPVGAAYAM